MLGYLVRCVLNVVLSVDLFPLALYFSVDLFPIGIVFESCELCLQGRVINLFCLS